MDVAVIECRAMRVATVHHVGPYEGIGEAVGKLGAIAGAAGLMDDPSATLLALYHDDPGTTPAEELQSDAGIVIADDQIVPPTLGEARVPAGTYARIIHRGPYEQLHEVWSWLMREWLPASGHRIGSGPSCEIYLNNPHGIPPEDILTELRIPLAS